MGTPVHTWADRRLAGRRGISILGPVPTAPSGGGEGGADPVAPALLLELPECSPLLEACVWGEAGSGGRTCSAVCASFQVSQSR